MFDLKGKVAVVTGGGSGIGEATALELGALGAHVVVADINAGNADKVRAALNEAGVDAMALELNVTDATAVESAFDSIERWKGKPVDILVNSAGLISVSPILELGIEEWNRVMSVNVTGTFLCSQRAAKGMQAQGYGRIVNLSSISAERAGVGRVVYGTSKAAVAALTRQFAMEMGPYGITTNAVAPGPVVTPMTEKSYDAETVAAFSSMIPARRLGTLREMSTTIAFLCSEHAGYINGQYLAVDGGYVIAGVARTGGVVAG